MVNFFINLRWKLYKFYSKQLLLWGLKKGYIQPYSEELIQKLRGIYYGGVPASVLLLCDKLTNGHCYDRALLMSRAFLDDEGDVKLVYATVDDLRFDPSCIKSGNGSDHCFVERITKDGERLIYDTSEGFVYTKWIYWLISHPKVRKINDKQSIIDFVESDQEVHPDNAPFTKRLIIPLVIAPIESTYGQKGELYSAPGIELLQREVELYKSTL